MRIRIAHRFTEMNCQISELPSLVRTHTDRVTSNYIQLRQNKYPPTLNEMNALNVNSSDTAKPSDTVVSRAHVRQLPFYKETIITFTTGLESSEKC